MTDALRDKLARIALACSDYTATDALDKIIASIDRKAKRSHPPAVPLEWECLAGGLKRLTDVQYRAQPANIRRHYTRIAMAPAVPHWMALHEAAQAVLARWDSPQWEWAKHGPTADLMAALRAELAAAQPPAAQPESAQPVLATGAQPWQTMESAPKDGRKVIVSYLNRSNKPRTVMARWLTDEQAAETDGDDVGLEAGWYECIDNWNDYTEVAIHEGEPLHWMPLPAPPHAAHTGSAAE